MKRIFIILFLSIISLCFSQEDWDIGFKNGIITVSYKGFKILNSVELNAFQPDYKAQLFSIRKANHKEENGKHIFHHTTDSCDATIAISFSGTQMTMDVEANPLPQLPVEFSLMLATKNLQLQNGKLYIRNNHRTQLVGNENIDSVKLMDFSIEQEKYTHSIIPTGNIEMSLQDRRNSAGFLRTVSVFRLNAPGNAPMRQRIEWRIREYDEKQAALRAERTLRHAAKCITPITVSNADFEQESTDWTCQSNVTFEQVDEKHGKSARMDVQDPKTDSVYITRLIPITPGARYAAHCDIRTKDVTMAQGKMSSVGACLIVEWGDKNRKWLTSGVYSRGIWNTQEWTRVECKNLRAPDDAHYAYVYIALRAKGTAWYDNFEIYQQEESAIKTSPAEGEIVKTNAPLFQWHSMNGIDTYTLKLSQNPDFPEAETSTHIVDVESFLQLRTPLKSGVWYWLVNAKGFPDKSPASFVIDTPPQTSILPPQIIAQHARLLAPNEQYHFSVNTPTRLKSLAIADDDSPDRQFDVRELPEKRYAIIPNGGWKNGLNTLSITATADNGASETRKVWIVCSPKPENVIVIDKEGRYSENGKHIFPLGIYEVAPEFMPEVKEAGFEVVHIYKWEGTQDDDAAKTYLDAAQVAGLRVFIGFDRGHHSPNGIVQGNLELLARRVGKLASHPALFCWYLFDEPEVAAYYVPPKRLTAFAELLRMLDPYHPVVMTTWGKNMNAYRKTWDTHWTQSYSKPAEVVKTIADHRRLLLNDSPITLLVHCYDQTQSRLLKQNQPVNWDDFKPDYDWMRAAALVGLAKDVNGLWWWWHAKSVPGWMTAAQNPKTWENLTKVVQEVRSLRPILNADGPTQTGTVVVGNDKIEWWLKSVNGKHTIIIVNTSEEDVEATITPKDFPPIPVKLGRFGVRIINQD